MIQSTLPPEPPHRVEDRSPSSLGSIDEDTLSSQLVVRRVTLLDLPVLLTMVHCLAAHHGERAQTTLDDLRRDLFGGPSEIGPWGVALIASAGDETIGYAVLYPKLKLEAGSRGMELHHLFVVPSWREQGVGKEIVDAAAALAADHGCDFVSVGAHADNARAHGFYDDAGFTRSSNSGPRWKRAV